MKQLEMYEFDNFVHCRCRSSTIVYLVLDRSLSNEFIRFWVSTISFFVWSVIAILYETVELLTKHTPGERNRLALLAAESMTYSNPSS